MEQSHVNRFKDASWFSSDNSEKVIVGGAGGIGSWLSILLVRAGFSPILYDFDIIEEHNIGGQLFKEEDVGLLKVDAVARIIKELCGKQINKFSIPYTETSMRHIFMFSAFDNMQARKDMFNSWKKACDNSMIAPLFIDGRLEFEQLQIFCVTPQTADKYEQEHLFDDSMVEDAPCTLRQTSHSAAMIASHMVGFFTNHISNINTRELTREVPFYYEYFIPINLTTESS